MEPLISVIIPVYNMEKYLVRAVDSVISQSYKNLEIILVDDGSTDKSPVICDDYAKTDSRVVVVHKENGGLSSARNSGLDVARGEYIAFLDSDDFLNRDFILMLFESCVKNATQIAICGYKKVFFKGKNAQIKKQKPVEIMSGRKASLEIVDLDAGIYIPAWNKLYKREVFENIRFPEGKYSEDFYVSYEVLSRAQKVAILDEKLYNYVQRNESIIHARDDISNYNLEALEGYGNFLKKGDYKDSQKEYFGNLIINVSINNILEDYWRAYKNKNSSRMSELIHSFKELKTKADASNVELAPEALLFDRSPNRYVFERRIFEALRSVKFFFVSLT